MIESIGIMCGIALGMFGSVFSVVQFLYQKKLTERMEKEQAERQAQRDKEQAERQAQRDREQAERQAQRDKEQAERQAQRDREQAERQAQRDKEQDRKDRMEFLKEMIIDQDISIEGRRPFFDEYLSLGGNGSVVRFWNHEVEGRKRIEGAQR